nr:hypothetical protein [Dendronalium sp. ChiSLP03b]MDZ8206670.1 hypothetical protein [Dendronalium sp. ChiSLP03b]
MLNPKGLELSCHFLPCYPAGRRSAYNGQPLTGTQGFPQVEQVAWQPPQRSGSPSGESGVAE